MKKCFLIVTVCLVECQLLAQSPEEMINKIKAKLEMVSDYTAKGRLKTNVVFIKAPIASVKVFYKKPDKMKIVNEKGISFIPKGSVNINLAKFLSAADNYEIVDAGKEAKRVARLLCAGGSHVSVQRADYIGIESCAAAVAVGGGGKGCVWGCVGLADCAVACTFDAIHMNDFGLPVVEVDKCTACNDCVVACPLGLFTILPLESKLIVQCKNLLLGDDATEVCAVACNACGRCVADAAPGLISMQNGLAVIDYSKISEANPAATARCPTNAIAWVEGAQFNPQLIEA